MIFEVLVKKDRASEILSLVSKSYVNTTLNVPRKTPKNTPNMDSAANDSNLPLGGPVEKMWFFLL
jgi:hypothetical protein